MGSNIDLNADLGESENANDIRRDIAIMDIVTSVSIACGGHAGNDDIMRIMLSAASERGLRVGAHPSYPDRENFGRLRMQMDSAELSDSLSCQIATIAAIADKMGGAIAYVKPHGALYNDAASNTNLAQLVTNCTKSALPGAALMGLAGGNMQSAAAKANIPFIAEAFIDRQYGPDGFLQPRSADGAVIVSQAVRVEQALLIAAGRGVTSSGGSRINITADTLCLHSDSDDALGSARAVHDALIRAGFTIGQPQ